MHAWFCRITVHSFASFILEVVAVSLLHINIYIDSDERCLLRVLDFVVPLCISTPCCESKKK
jgi:hypothetical protein